MSRFLRKKTEKWPAGERDEEELARDVGKLVKAAPGSRRRGKNQQRVTGPVELPKIDGVDFRTSLILPGLSKRFSVLQPSLSSDLSESDLRDRLATQRTRATGGPSLTIEEEELVVAELRRQQDDDWDGEPPVSSYYSSASTSVSPNPTPSPANPSSSYFSSQTQSPPPSSTSFGSLNTFGPSSSVLDRDRGVSRAYGSTSTSGMREAEYIRRTRKQSEAQRDVSASNSQTSLADSESGRTGNHIPVQATPQSAMQSLSSSSSLPRVSSRAGSRTHSPSASLSLAAGQFVSHQVSRSVDLPSSTHDATAEATIPRSPRRRSLLAGLTPAQVKRISAALEEIELDMGPRPGIRRNTSEAAIAEEAEEDDEEEVEDLNDEEALYDSYSDAPSVPHALISPGDAHSSSSHPAASEVGVSDSTPPARGYVPGMVRFIGSSGSDHASRRRSGSVGSQQSQASSRARSGSTPLPLTRVSSLARSQSTTHSGSNPPSRGPTPTPPVSIAQLRNGMQPSGIHHQPYHFLRRPSSPFVNSDAFRSSPEPRSESVGPQSTSSIGSNARAYVTQPPVRSSHFRSDSAASHTYYSQDQRNLASPVPTLRSRASAGSLGSTFIDDDDGSSICWDSVIDQKQDQSTAAVNDATDAAMATLALGGLSKGVLEEMQNRLVRNAKEIRDALRGPEVVEPPRSGLAPRPSFRARHVSTNPEDEAEFRRAMSPPPVASPPIPSRHQHNPSQTSIQRMLQGRAPIAATTEDAAGEEPVIDQEGAEAPVTSGQDPLVTKEERTQALAQALFGDDGKLLSPQTDSTPFIANEQDAPAPVSIRDDPAVIRDFEERIAKATAMLQRTPSAKPLSRKGTKRGQTPKVISSPQLVSSTVQIPTTPLSPPGTASRSQTDIDPTIARALEKASGTKMSARIKRLAGFKKTPVLETTTFASPSPLDAARHGGLAAPIDLQSGSGSAPAVMDHFKFPNSSAPSTPDPSAPASGPSSMPSPPLSANPQGIRGVMTRFKRNRKKSDAALSRPDSPGFGLVEPKELKALVRSMPGQSPKPDPPTLQLTKSNTLPTRKGIADVGKQRVPTSDAAVTQLYSAADALGLDSAGLDHLLAASIKSPPTASGPRVDIGQSAPPFPTSILRSTSRSGEKPNVVVRRTIIIPQNMVPATEAIEEEPEPQPITEGSQRKLSIKRKPVKLNFSDRELVSGEHQRAGSMSSVRTDNLGTIDESATTTAPRSPRNREDSGTSDLLSPTRPSGSFQLPNSPSGQSFATSNRRSSAGGSFYDLYADYHDEDPVAEADEREPSAARHSHAVEICELSNGQVVWSLVEGLRDFEQPQRDSIYSNEELDSQYAYSRPVSAVIPAGSSEPLQLYIKGHQRNGSGARNSAGSTRRRQAKANGERPETKVYYSSSNNVVDLIDSLSRNLDQGRFDIIPTSPPGTPNVDDESDRKPGGSHPLNKVSTPASLVTVSSDGQSKSRTVEERLQALLDRMQAIPAADHGQSTSQRQF